MMEIFDPKSIEVNKRGQKSEKQIKEIKEAVQPGLWLYAGLGILVFGGCFSSMMNAMGGSSAVSIFGWIIAAVGLLAALRGFTTWNLRRKLLAEPVQSAEGTVEFSEPTLTDPARYTAKTIEGRKLNPIGLAGASAPLPPGDYRFFFLNTRSWLLGAEPLSSEEEMRNSLNNALGYDKSRLEDCHRQAQAGTLKIAEGLPKLDSYKNSVINENEIAKVDYFCTLGGIKFDISSGAAAGIITNIPYRIYYRKGETSITAMEVA
jgi:hypothetical protein